MIDCIKIDAALFAIEGFVSRLITHNDNLDHADYYLSMVRNLRGTISKERFDRVIQPVKEMDSNLADMEDRLRSMPRGKKKKRPSDKGTMSTEARAKLSKAMRAHHAKRRKAGRKVGR